MSMERCGGVQLRGNIDIGGVTISLEQNNRKEAQSPFFCCTDSTICTVCAVCALTHKEKRTTVMVLKKERMKGAMLGTRVEAI